ncbi:hypothetical protein BC938DRAFT_470599, partial [Jimgerdemannia flammicorona]
MRSYINPRIGPTLSFSPLNLLPKHKQQTCLTPPPPETLLSSKPPRTSTSSPQSPPTKSFLSSTPCSSRLSSVITPLPSLVCSIPRVNTSGKLGQKRRVS